MEAMDDDGMVVATAIEVDMTRPLPVVESNASVSRPEVTRHNLMDVLKAEYPRVGGYTTNEKSAFGHLIGLLTCEERDAYSDSAFKYISQCRMGAYDVPILIRDIRFSEKQDAVSESVMVTWERALDTLIKRILAPFKNGTTDTLLCDFDSPANVSLDCPHRSEIEAAEATTFHNYDTSQALDPPRVHCDCPLNGYVSTAKAETQAARVETTKRTAERRAAKGEAVYVYVSGFMDTLNELIPARYMGQENQLVAHPVSRNILVGKLFERMIARHQIPDGCQLIVQGMMANGSRRYNFRCPMLFRPLAGFNDPRCKSTWTTQPMQFYSNDDDGIQDMVDVTLTLNGGTVVDTFPATNSIGESDERCMWILNRAAELRLADDVRPSGIPRAKKRVYHDMRRTDELPEHERKRRIKSFIRSKDTDVLMNLLYNYRWQRHNVHFYLQMQTRRVDGAGMLAPPEKACTPAELEVVTKVETMIDVDLVARTLERLCGEGKRFIYTVPIVGIPRDGQSGYTVNRKIEEKHMSMKMRFTTQSLAVLSIWCGNDYIDTHCRMPLYHWMSVYLAQLHHIGPLIKVNETNGRFSHRTPHRLVSVNERAMELLTRWVYATDMSTRRPKYPVPHNVFCLSLEDLATVYMHDTEYAGTQCPALTNAATGGVWMPTRHAFELRVKATALNMRLAGDCNWHDIPNPVSKDPNSPYVYKNPDLPFPDTRSNVVRVKDAVYVERIVNRQAEIDRRKAEGLKGRALTRWPMPDGGEFVASNNRDLRRLTHWLNSPVGDALHAGSDGSDRQYLCGFIDPAAGIAPGNVVYM